jgi:hypothetical protein
MQNDRVFLARPAAPNLLATTAARHDNAAPEKKPDQPFVLSSTPSTESSLGSMPSKDMALAFQVFYRWLVDG